MNSEKNFGTYITISLVILLLTISLVWYLFFRDKNKSKSKNKEGKEEKVKKKGFDLVVSEMNYPIREFVAKVTKDGKVIYATPVGHRDLVTGNRGIDITNELHLNFSSLLNQANREVKLTKLSLKNKITGGIIASKKIDFTKKETSPTLFDPEKEKELGAGARF